MNLGSYLLIPLTSGLILEPVRLLFQWLHITLLLKKLNVIVYNYLKKIDLGQRCMESCFQLLLQ